MATRVGARPENGVAAVVCLRDRLAHRGPDGAGLWDGSHVVFGHRRLVVIDPTEGGHQPMVSPGGDAIVYNGELYNDADLRRELAGLGHEFSTASDTETVLAALCRWGVGGLARLRGMYAIAFYNARARTLLLARDPLGIKPLYVTRRSVAGRGEIAFASEAPVLAGVGWRATEPDVATVSAYLTTIRTSIGHRTLFRDVLTLMPGEALLVDLTRDELPASRVLDRSLDGPVREITLEDAGAELRRTLEESVKLHLRSDVPMCSLLSGGIDSTVIAAMAKREVGRLSTYCAGASGDDGAGDMSWARRASAAIGTTHTEVPIDPAMFISRWREMVDRQGVVLGTPNEVAINEVARVLRAATHVVALSGEGADELLGGYEAPMAACAAHVHAGNADPGVFQLHEAAWMTPDMKRVMLHERVWSTLEADAGLVAWYREEFARVAALRDDESPLQAHLRFMRRINLAGLLQRLDSAMMLEGVEGRTPFADIRVAALCESLPMRCKYEEGVGTKLALRAACAGLIPDGVRLRAKASVPLPFQEWIRECAGEIGASAFLRTLVRDEALALVAAEPGKLWRLAWPMANLALWGRRWE